MSHPPNFPPAAVGEVYDWVCDQYDVPGDSMHFGYWTEPTSGEPNGEGAEDVVADFLSAQHRLTDLAMEKLGVTAEDRVLDVGCGVGGPAVRLARATGARVVGVNVSGSQVREATRLVSEEGLGEQVRFQQCDAMAMPFPDASFDAAWALESIIHMPDRGRLLREVARVLRPGGRLVLTDIVARRVGDAGRQPLLDLVARTFMMNSLLPIADYPRLFASAGLTDVEVLDLSERTVPRTLFAWDQVFVPLGPLRPPELAAVEELGYALAAARRPSAG